ncbi:hypothetical protein KBD61_01835 [Patescibacteria group bacterium]|nr:hypothetical protein [Patescibacteria group bacterium]MBP9709751.1 hypothetical protein [Patescibacteria group bacterium]
MVMVMVFGSYELSVFILNSMIGELVTAARRDGAVQVIVRSVDTMDERSIKDNLAKILGALALPNEVLRVKYKYLNLTGRDGDSSANALVCTITSSRSNRKKP